MTAAASGVLAPAAIGMQRARRIVIHNSRFSLTLA